MKFKPLYLLAFAIAMAAGLAACNENEPEPEPEPTFIIVAGTPTPAPARKRASAEGSYGDRGVFRYDDRIDINALVRYNAQYVDDPRELWLYKWAADKMNINFIVEGVPNEDAPERTGIVFASGDLPDVMLNWDAIGSVSMLTRFGDAEGLLRPLNEYVYDPEIMPNLCELNAERAAPLDLCKTASGNIYGFPRYNQKIEFTLQPSGTSLWYDKTVFTDAEYPEAPETIEELIEALAAVKTLDPRELGEKNIPIGGAFGHQDFGHLILQAYGLLTTDVRRDRGVMDAATGDSYLTMEFSYLKTHPKYYRYLVTMRFLYENGLIDRDYFTLDDAAVKAGITDGLNAAFAAGNTANLVTIKWKNWDLTGPLVSEINQKKIAPLNGGPGGLSYAGYVTAACPDVEFEAFMRFMDLGYSNECGDLFFAGPRFDSDYTAVQIDDAYGMTSGWYWRDSHENTERVYQDVESGKFSTWGGYVSSVSPFGPLGGRFNRATDGSELQWSDPSTVAGYYASQSFAKLTPYLIYNVYGLAYEPGDALRLEELEDRFDEIALAETEKFITGSRPLNDAEWDKYVRDITDLGLEDYEGLIRDARVGLK